MIEDVRNFEDLQRHALREDKMNVERDQSVARSAGHMNSRQYIHIPIAVSLWWFNKGTLFWCWGEWRASHWQPGLEDLF